MLSKVFTTVEREEFMSGNEFTDGVKFKTKSLVLNYVQLISLRFWKFHKNKRQQKTGSCQMIN